MARFVVLVGVLVASASAHATYVCRDLFSSPQTPAIRAIVSADSYHQWLLWEQTANLPQFRKPSEMVPMRFAWLERGEVNVEFNPDVPIPLKNAFVSGDAVRWYKHPYNSDPTVPFATRTDAGEVPVSFTASRSLAFGFEELRGFTIKPPTDRPHGPNGAIEPTKTRTGTSVALARSNFVARIDAELGGEDASLGLLRDVGTITDRTTGIGVVVRDVRTLDDGHYYLPVLSLPYVGRDIARANKRKFESFWRVHFAEAVGRAKAKFILRYGLQMETPNPQNILVQLDRSLRPTGRVIFRDLSDSVFVENVAEAFGFSDAIAADKAVGRRPDNAIRPFWSNSSWRFEQAGESAVDPRTLEEWGLAHNRAYLDELERALRVPFTDIHVTAESDSIGMATARLTTGRYQKALRVYRARLLKK